MCTLSLCSAYVFVPAPFFDLFSPDVRVPCSLVACNSHLGAGIITVVRHFDVALWV